MRRIIKRRFLKSRELKNHRILGYFGEAFDRRQLWHVTRHSVAKAVAVGIFAAYLPIPFEMIVAAVLAFILKANLPISVLLIWISNPFTWAILWGPPYMLGAALLGQPEEPIEAMTRDWIEQHYEALLLGCSLTGAAMAVAAYFSILLLWRMDVIKQWEIRREMREKTHLYPRERKKKAR